MEAHRRPRRTYARAEVAPGQGAWLVQLDGEPARTPAGALLYAPTRALAQALAGDYASQGERVDPSTMPFVRIAHSAIDAVAPNPGPVRADVVNFAQSDLVCYRASSPASLVAAQAAAWDPVLVFAREAMRARFVLSEGVINVEQPHASIEAVRAAVEALDPSFGLAALHVMTTLTGSVLIALAVIHERLSASEAWAAAHVDEDEQIAVWGEDAEAAERRAHRWTEMEAAARVGALLRAP
jgi:chaperone required for assembly of F1-ATPase